MARDFSLAWPCPHMTLEEVVALDSDRRSLYTRQPIGGLGTVRITANDDVVIPQGGLFSAAEVYGSQSGPFDVIELEDVLAVSTSILSKGTDTAQWDLSKTDYFKFPRGTRYSSSEVVKLLQRGLAETDPTKCLARPDGGSNGNSQILVGSSNGHLTFTNTTAVGPDAVVRIGGTAAGSLGFAEDQQQVAVGTMLFPPWGIYDRPIENKIDATSVSRYPKFSYPVKTNPVFKVTYSVPPNRCLRCRGSYIENDIRFDPTGQTIMIQDENLLYQAALKIILTDRGSNPYNPWYGTQLRSRIGSKVLAGVAAVISEDVRQALSRFQNLQEAQAKYQSISYKERLYAVLAVNVKTHSQDNTTFLVEVIVQNASGEAVNLTTIFTVPSVVALMGSNGLMLGTQAVGLGEDQLVVGGRSKMKVGQ